VVLATIFYALSLNGIKHYLSSISSVSATLGAFTITGPFALIYLFIGTDFMSDINNHPSGISSFGYVSILAILGTALSVIVYNTLIKEAGTVFAATCTYLIPIVAVMWGLLDKEPINLWQIFGILVIIFSIYLINKR
jgi:drug/metabolite transporter (DMT)-like permease